VRSHRRVFSIGARFWRAVIDEVPLNTEAALLIFEQR